MKFKLIEIRSLEGSLVKLTNKELPVRVAYRLSRVLKRVTEELSSIENYRVKLVKKYSKGEDEKGIFEVAKGEEEKFGKEFSELLMEEIDIDFEPILLSDLGDICLTPIDLIRLEKIILEEKIKE